MARVKRHVELDDIHLKFLHSRFPGVSISYILNEMLFHFHNITLEKEVDVNPILKESAERAAENIKKE